MRYRRHRPKQCPVDRHAETEKRIAAAIVPEMAAEAPIIGNCSPACVAKCSAAPAAAVTAKNARKRTVPKRRAIALPKGKSQIELTKKMRPVRVNEGVGHEGPHVPPTATRQRVTEH